MTGRGPSRLRVVLPWLEAALHMAAAEGRAADRAPAAEWLVARSTTGPGSSQSWREWLVAGVDAGSDLLRRYPAGPSVRAMRSGSPPEGTWACARPVHLATAIEHLLLAPGEVGISFEDTQALLVDINRHFEDRGFRFHAQASEHDWQLECQDAIDCSSVEPEVAAGSSLRDQMPAGRDGARVCSLMNEIQMLLHEHPVNLEREANGQYAINSLWLWGFGQLTAARAEILPPLYSDDAWLVAIWRMHGATSSPLEDFATRGHCDGQPVLFAWSRPPGADLDEVLARAERDCFAPALAALRSGEFDAIDMLLGGRVFAVEASARLKFWRRRKPLAEALQ